jgi:hypothetical protein
MLMATKRLLAAVLATGAALAALTLASPAPASAAPASGSTGSLVMCVPGCGPRHCDC